MFSMGIALRMLAEERHYEFGFLRPGSDNDMRTTKRGRRRPMSRRPRVAGKGRDGLCFQSLGSCHSAGDSLVLAPCNISIISR